MTSNQNTLTRINIYAFAIINIDNLKCTKSFNLNNLIFFQICLDDIEHLTYEGSGIALIETVTRHKCLC